jgi:transaldolase / glucose-6-phosphate isomerase
MSRAGESRHALAWGSAFSTPPSFQHSTGQISKGAPGSGVFVQITCNDAVGLALPGHSDGFGTAKEGRARGDLCALAGHELRALRVSPTGVSQAGRALRETIQQVLP